LAGGTPANRPLQGRCPHQPFLYGYVPVPVEKVVGEDTDHEDGGACRWLMNLDHATY